MLGVWGGGVGFSADASQLMGLQLVSFHTCSAAFGVLLGLKILKGAYTEPSYQPKHSAACTPKINSSP